MSERKSENEAQKLKFDVTLELNSLIRLVQSSLGLDSVVTFSICLAKVLGFDQEQFDEKEDYYSSRLVDMT